MEVFKISSNTNPSSVAGAIASIIKEDGNVELQSIGAGAVNQAVKAIAIARGYLAPIGRDVVCTPSFMTVEFDGASRTGIRLKIEEK